MNRTNDLIQEWRRIGPVAWAESSYGWIGEDGQPITFTPWQRAALLAWWENRATCSTFAISNVKKTGKTFANAILTCWRWLALPGVHFCAANDLDQSAGRQFYMIGEMVQRHPYLSQEVRIGKAELRFEPTNSTLTALAVDAAGNAGANFLTSSHTEAFGIVYENGIRQWEELTPVPGRFYGLPCLRIADSVAGYVGESNIWHTLVDRGLAGQRLPASGGRESWPIYQAGGLLLFHADGLEAQERCYRGTPEEAAAYYAEQHANLRPGTFERLHLNKRASGEEAFIDMASWDACVSMDRKPLLSTDMPVYAAVDASIKHDSSAVVVVGYDSSKSGVLLVRHRIWQPSGNEPLDIDGTIGAFLREVRKTYNLREVRYDPYQMHDLATRLRTEGLPMVEYPQTVANLTQMGSNLYDLVTHRNLFLYPDEQMRRAAGHTIAIQTGRGWKISKEKASFKIDVIVSLAMAAQVAVEKGSAPLQIFLGDGGTRDYGSSSANTRPAGMPVTQMEAEWKRDAPDSNFRIPPANYE